MARQANATDQARRLLTSPISFEDFRAKVSARDGQNIDRHLAALEEQPEEAHRNLWKRLISTLATLAPHAISTTGQQVISFFIADGKYRMQVFALEDKLDGKLVIYASDALKDALAAKLLRPPTKDVAESFLHQLENGQTLAVEHLTAQNTPNPGPFYKHMLGWNRTAMRITLPVHANKDQVSAAETLCALAAVRWAQAATKSTGSGPGGKPLDPKVLVGR